MARPGRLFAATSQLVAAVRMSRLNGRCAVTPAGPVIGYVKTRLSPALPIRGKDAFPSADDLAALRAWYEGLDARRSSDTSVCEKPPVSRRARCCRPSGARSLGTRAHDSAPTWLNFSSTTRRRALITLGRRSTPLRPFASCSCRCPRSRTQSPRGCREEWALHCSEQDFAPLRISRCGCRDADAGGRPFLASARSLPGRSKRSLRRTLS